MGPSHNEKLRFEGPFRTRDRPVSTEVNRRLDLNTELPSIHRTHGVPTRKGLTPIRRFSLSAETYRTDVSEDGSIVL